MKIFCLLGLYLSTLSFAQNIPVAFWNSGIKNYTIILTANESNVGIQNKITALGWNGIAKVKVNVTINSGVRITGLSTGVLPTGSQVTIVNNGIIVGQPGTSGGYPGTAGGTGGIALTLSVPTTLMNNGTICGGGGGGGWGTGKHDASSDAIHGATGGGSGGVGIVVTTATTIDNAGTIAGGGRGGDGGSGGYDGVSNGGGGGGGAGFGSGGNGNGWPYYVGWFGLSAPSQNGLPGGLLTGGVGGSGAVGGNTGGTGGAGGAAGSSPAVQGNANITWLSNGTRLGVLN